jgi:hypothetical protein
VHHFPRHIVMNGIQLIAMNRLNDIVLDRIQLIVMNRLNDILLDPMQLIAMSQLNELVIGGLNQRVMDPRKWPLVNDRDRIVTECLKWALINGLNQIAMGRLRRILMSGSNQKTIHWHPEGTVKVVRLSVHRVTGDEVCFHLHDYGSSCLLLPMSLLHQPNPRLGKPVLVYARRFVGPWHGERHGDSFGVTAAEFAPCAAPPVRA